MSVNIQGTSAVKAAVQQAAAVARSGGPLQQAVGMVAQRVRAYAAQVTHVDTGALQASHAIDQAGTYAEIYISPATLNPRSLKPPEEYGPYEHARGGDHAFYRIAFEEEGPRALADAGNYLRRYLP